ncbi:MAG: hypothetical protein U1E87_03455 [Alphaproteobacteria bacterium]
MRALVTMSVAAVALGGAATAEARQPAEKVHAVEVAGETLKLPLLDRYCSLDPANAPERQILEAQVKQASAGKRKVLLMQADCAELAAQRAKKGVRFGLIEFLVPVRPDGQPAKLMQGVSAESLLSEQASKAPRFNAAVIDGDLAGSTKGGTPKPSSAGLIAQTENANYIAQFDQVAVGSGDKASIVTAATIGGMTVVDGVPVFATISRFNPGPGGFQRLLDEDKALVAALQAANTDGN